MGDLTDHPCGRSSGTCNKVDSPIDPWDNEGVKKKRRAWWIVGGVACFVVLSIVTVMLVETNRPDARLERAIREIIAEQKFEYKGRDVGYLRGSNKEVLSDMFCGGPLSQEDGKWIVAQLRQACPKCSVEVVTAGVDILPVTMPSDEPTYDIHSWSPQEGSAIMNIMVIFDDKGIGDQDDSPSSSLTVSRYGEVDRWSFLKNLWPW